MERRSAPDAAAAAADQARRDDMCLCEEEFVSDPCSVMGCYGSLDARGFLSDADSAADMELDDAADSTAATARHEQQQHQRTLQWLVASSSSMGVQELAKAAAVAAASDTFLQDSFLQSRSAAAEHEHAGIMQTLLQQVLEKAAVQRKRSAVLQAGPDAGCA
jgi:hypothetical protein